MVLVFGTVCNGNNFGTDTRISTLVRIGNSVSMNICMGADVSIRPRISLGIRINIL